MRVYSRGSGCRGQKRSEGNGKSGEFHKAASRLFFDGDCIGERHAELQRRTGRSCGRHDSRRCRLAPAEGGSQTEEPVEWRVEDFLQEEHARTSLPLENRRVELRCWKYEVKGVRGFEVPVYFLDADLPSNVEADRNLTGALYGGDSYYRLCQEVLLGIGGVRMLRALGYTELT